MKTLMASLLFLVGTAQAADPLTIDVHRDPNCGCCKAWIGHLEQNGFQVNDHVTTDMMAKKQELGVPAELASCHTAIFNGAFVEGHVPAEDVRRLADMPEAAGVAVPGMPIGSPGMEMGSRQDPYSVVLIRKDGDRQEMSRYP
jgi:hypothetical protein